MACDTVQSGRFLLPFQRNELSKYSGQNSKKYMKISE
jgi:hypothetical protein